MVTALLLVACGLGEPAQIRSGPADPHVDLTGEGPMKVAIVWSDLAEMFPETPGMARPLSGLVPGMPAEDAEAKLMAARIEGARVERKTVEGHDTVWSRLQHGQTEVGVTLVLDPQNRLQSVDLAVDWGAASSVLVERWGEPADGPPLTNGYPLHRWPGAPWSVELHRLPEGQGVIHMTRER